MVDIVSLISRVVVVVFVVFSDGDRYWGPSAVPRCRFAARCCRHRRHRLPTADTPKTIDYLTD